MKIFLSLSAALILVMGAAAAYGQADGGSETAKPHTPKCRARTLDLRAPSFSCTFGGYRSKKNIGSPLAVQDTSIDSINCTELYLLGANMGAPPVDEYALAADTLQFYVEHCGHNDTGFMLNVFGNIAGDVAASGPGGTYPGNDVEYNFLQWLFKVLYYDTTSRHVNGAIDTGAATKAYYCNDAVAAAGVMDALDIHDSAYHANPIYGAAGSAALEKYLIASGKCPFYAGQLELDLQNLYQSWHRYWKDTVKDSMLTPWDTTVPTLQQIGFEILLGPQYGAVHAGIYPKSVLGAIGVSPNPFVGQTEINYTLNVPATLTVEVYDLLGHKVAAPVPSVFTRNGDYSIMFAAQFPPGTYYIRFSVPEGEVRTIRITKE